MGGASVPPEPSARDGRQCFCNCVRAMGTPFKVREVASVICKRCAHKMVTAVLYKDHMCAQHTLRSPQPHTHTQKLTCITDLECSVQNVDMMSAPLMF